MNQTSKENWGSGEPYDLYVGRWSRKVAVEFLAWISVRAQSAWGDVGCGTGALTQCILSRCDPRSIAATRSPGALAEKSPSLATTGDYNDGIDWDDIIDKELRALKKTGTENTKDEKDDLVGRESNPSRDVRSLREECLRPTNFRFLPAALARERRWRGGQRP